MKKMNNNNNNNFYYAVRSGRVTGIFIEWSECYKSVDKFKNSQYKKFNTLLDATVYLTDPIYNKVEVEDENSINVYTDGSCIYNNANKNRRAGFGVYFSHGDERNVSERVTGKQTNNVAELLSIIRVYDILKQEIDQGIPINIFSDSTYAINCCGSYGEKCREKRWSGKIKNINLVKRAFCKFKGKKNIRFHHIEAHTNKTDIHSEGNRMADKLAKEGAYKIN